MKFKFLSHRIQTFLILFVVAVNNNVVHSELRLPLGQQEFKWLNENSVSSIELTNTPEFVLKFFGDDPESYVDCGSSSSFSPSEFSLEAWVYPENRNGNYILANEAHSGTEGPQGFVLRLTGQGYLEFAMGSGGKWEQVTGSDKIIALNQWTHVAVTFSAENMIRIYVNGIEENSVTTATGLTPTDQQLFIGESPSWPGRRLTGRLYDIRLWNTVRTAEEIKTDMNTFLTGSEPGLTANWKLDEGSGSVINDQTNVFEGVRGNGTKWVRFSSLKVDHSAYLLNQRKDSVIIYSDGLIINQWTIKNNASAGNAYLASTSAEQAILVYEPDSEVYEPDSEVYIQDSIVVEAVSVDEEHLETYVIFNIYPNKYQLEGELLLDRIIDQFYNNSNGLYAEDINSEGAVIRATSYLWPASHLLRAMKYAYRVNQSKYAKPLAEYIVALDQYIFTRNGTKGYAAYPDPNDTRFYDDNGLLIIQFADIARDSSAEGIIDRAEIAYDFNNDVRDTHWGIPQHENQLEEGMFYSMAVNQTGLGAVMLFELTGDQAYLDEAKMYYQQLNNPDVLIKDQQSNLFHQYTFFQNNTWSFSGTLNGVTHNGRGYRAYQTSHVIQHAIELYKITDETSYLNDANEMANACRNHFYSEGKGLNENSFWGGNDLIDAFLDLYKTTGDVKWLNTCSDILDFLIENGKDKLGYYPSNYDDNYGKWNLVRTNIEPTQILMMGQAAAASAMMHVAYYEANPIVNSLDQNKLDFSGNVKIWPTVISTGENMNILMGSQDDYQDLSISFYTISGHLMKLIQVPNHNMAIPLQFEITDVPPGMYILKMIAGGNLSTGKFLVH